MSKNGAIELENSSYDRELKEHQKRLVSERYTLDTWP